MHDASIKLKLYPNPVQYELHITNCEPEAMVNIFALCLILIYYFGLIRNGQAHCLKLTTVRINSL